MIKTWSAGEIITATVVGVGAIILGILAIGGASFWAGHTVATQSQSSSSTPAPTPTLLPVPTPLDPEQQCWLGTNDPVRGKAGTVWTINDAAQTITIRTTFAKTFVDNTYGANVIDWPSKNHTFEQLVRSDHLQLALYDKSNVKRMEFKMDYLTADSATPSGYKTKGVLGGEGRMLLGNASDVTGVLTSLDVNFNTYGYGLTTNSPATDANYTPNPSYPNWIFDVWYEVTVQQSAFGSQGYGYPVITFIHASPSKTGENTEPVLPTPCPPPTPTPTPNLTPTPPTTSPPPPSPQCSDGLDNDGDGAVDCADPGCWVGDTADTCNPSDNDELHTPAFDPGPFQETD